jgi:hypothetical protein
MLAACEEIGSARTESPGTGSSNPVPSSGESIANLDFLRSSFSRAKAARKTGRCTGGSYPLPHLYETFGLVRLTRLGRNVPWLCRSVPTRRSVRGAPSIIVNPGSSCSIPSQNHLQIASSPRAVLTALSISPSISSPYFRKRTGAQAHTKAVMFFRGGPTSVEAG